MGLMDSTFQLLYINLSTLFNYNTIIIKWFVCGCTCTCVNYVTCLCNFELIFYQINYEECEANV